MVSFIGMETQVIKYKGESVLDVTMHEDSEQIEEVVVNGYYTKNKSSFTGNAVSVTHDELMKVSHSNLMTALQVFDPSFKLQESECCAEDAYSWRFGIWRNLGDQFKK